MQAALHFKTTILPGGKVEVTNPELPSGEPVDVIVLLPETPAAQGHGLFSFHIRDFMVFAKHFPQHCGIILAAQKSWTLAELIHSLDRLLSETLAVEWKGQVRWSNNWRNP